MAKTQSHKRTNYFVNKKFQTYFIIRFSLGIFLSTLLLVIILLYFSRSGTSIVFKNLRLYMIPTSEYLFSSIITGLFLSIFITSSISLFLGILISHRIAGPMHRFKLIFDHLKKGDFTKSTKLRAKDEWQETSHHLELAFTSIREKFNKLNDDFNELKENLNPKDTKTKNKVKKLEESINQFKF